jgi:hypothetical protein
MPRHGPVQRVNKTKIQAIYMKVLKSIEEEQEGIEEEQEGIELEMKFLEKFEFRIC